jgi:hypothetical protein
MKYRKKPVVIEAILWTGEDNERGIGAALNFIDISTLPLAPDDAHIHAGVGFTPSDGNLYIPTLEGTMCASPGDYIIKGVKGEYYPCKPDIFAATYEPVE